MYNWKILLSTWVWECVKGEVLDFFYIVMKNLFWDVLGRDDNSWCQINWILD